VPKLEYGNLSKFFADGREATLQAVREVVRNVRDSKLPDPAKLGNAGSFFMNPVVSLDKFEALLKEYPQMPSYDAPGGKKIPAGWMIDQCGWKGKSLGRAAVHDKQALVIVNTGNATGEDIVRLSDAVRKSVREKFGIDIQPEVNFIGK
jgi:UDP-N-acetylmuramate dehydrogenase